MFSFESFISYSNLKLVFKCLHGLAPVPISESIAKHQINIRESRATAHGDLREPYRNTLFGQSAFSVKGVKVWNSLPPDLKNEHDIMSFNRGVKTWLKENQTCTHT